jgi:hypothetical protein
MTDCRGNLHDDSKVRAASYRETAAEVREGAANAPVDLRPLFLQLAENYDALASHVEMIAGNRQPPDPAEGEITEHARAGEQRHTP